MFVLLTVPNIGPKTAYRLAKEFELTDEDTAVDELIYHAKEGHIRKMPDFGEKSEKVILEALQQVARREDRMLLSEAKQIAQSVLGYLKEMPDVIAAEALGSLRRHSSTVGDVDIAVATNNPEAVIDYLLVFPQAKKVLATGENVTRFIHSTNRQVDVKVQSPKEWGSTLQHYTGSKLHNIHLRTIAQKKGQSLSEYGIKDKGRLKKFRDEDEFYKFLGMSFIPPELREDTGEIEAALSKRLPKFIEQKSLRGDLHVHTNIDISTNHDIGRNTVAEILTKASSLNYDYIGFSDHNPRLSNLRPDQRIALIKYRNYEIDKATEDFNRKAKKPIHVLKGLEIDIRPDGGLALEDESIKLLDYAIASIHSQFNQSRNEATKRVLKALKHPKVKIFGHPTGRMLLRREGLNYDWENVFEFCQKNNKILEINSSPSRLDLPDTLVRQAIENKVMIVINSDAHDIEQMDLIEYGVWNARRGWAEARNVANTYKWEDLQNLLYNK
jgi:DNA polymerase (family X)